MFHYKVIGAQRAWASRWGKASVLLVSGLAGTWLLGGVVEPLPQSAALMERVVARAEQVAHNGQAPRYVYEKRARIEELDEAGKARKSTEKTYQVVWVQGLPLARLVKVQNRELTAPELQAEQRKEQELRKRVTGKDPAQMTQAKESWATKELVERFDFKVEGRERLQGRAVLRVGFWPKSSAAAEKSLQDKLLSRLAGSLWVDEAEAEVARLEVHLTEHVSIGWFGAIGSLKGCELLLERKRLEDGGWVNERQLLELHLRKLLSSTRLRTTEESYNFARQ